MSTKFVWLILIVIIGLCNQLLGIAQQENATEAKQEKPDPVEREMIETELKIVDPDGHPVADAEVYGSG